MLLICCLLVSTIRAACKVSLKVRSFSISRSFNFKSLSPKTNKDVIQDSSRFPRSAFFAKVFSALQNSSTVSFSLCFRSRKKCLLKFFDVSGSQCSLNLFSTTLILFLSSSEDHVKLLKIHIPSLTRATTWQLEFFHLSHRGHSRLCTSPSTFSTVAMPRIYFSLDSTKEVPAVSGVPFYYFKVKIHTF